MGIKIQRPKRITLLALMAFFFAAWNGLRLGYTVYLWKTLIKYKAQPLYIAFTGAFWMVLGLLLVWGLWKGKPWAWVGTLAVAAAYTAWYWLDRLFLQTPHANIEYSILASAILLFFVFIILITRRSRNFFRR